jgi:hypothetical protein
MGKKKNKGKNKVPKQMFGAQIPKAIRKSSIATPVACRRSDCGSDRCGCGYRGTDKARPGRRWCDRVDRPEDSAENQGETEGRGAERDRSKSVCSSPLTPRLSTSMRVAIYSPPARGLPYLVVTVREGRCETICATTRKEARLKASEIARGLRPVGDAAMSLHLAAHEAGRPH